MYFSLKFISENYLIGVKPGTIINWIRLWNSYPPEAQAMIAKDKEELRRGLIPPSVAVEAAYVARSIGMKAPEVLKETITNKWSMHDLRFVRRHAKKGFAVSKNNLEEVVNTHKKQTIEIPIFAARSTYQKFIEMTKGTGIVRDELIGFGLEFIIENEGRFFKFLTTKMQA